MANQAKATKARSLVNTPNKITINQLKVLISTLKRKEDGSIPKTKALLLAKLYGWEERDTLTMEEEDTLMKEEAVS